jgi:hypothetical protein
MVIVDGSLVLRQQLHGLLVGTDEHAVGEESHQVFVGTAGLLLLGRTRVDEGGAGGVENYRVLRWYISVIAVIILPEII